MGKPHTLPAEHTPGTRADLTILVNMSGHTFPLRLEPEERRAWLAVFRSTFGPKRTLVDELRAERELYDAGIEVRWDGASATFYADGRMTAGGSFR